MLTQVLPPPRNELTQHAAELAHPGTPWAMKLLNRVLGPYAARLWPFEPEALKRKARAAAGLSEFGAAGAVLDEPLAILCRSLAEEVRLNAWGRFGLHQQLVGNLVNRLRLEEFAARRPDVFEQPVPGPLFVTGTPRTGTTFLQRMVARDPRWRTMPSWEIGKPLPAGDLAAPQPDPDPRIKSGEPGTRFVNWILPEQATMHDLVNEEPDEENPILAAGHCSSMYECLALVPDYVRWYVAADHTAGYRYFRRFLQFMQWSRPSGDRWALKAPGHLEMLRPLLSVFGDATVVQTHRDPVTSVISFSSMVAYGARAYFDRPDPHLIGVFATDYIERLLRAAERDRVPGDRRHVDVYFHRLIEDPIREVRRVYEAAGRDLDDAAERPMREYAQAQGRRSGRHSYAAEDFALKVPELRERFAFYYDRFDVPLDSRV